MLPKSIPVVVGGSELPRQGKTKKPSAFEKTLLATKADRAMKQLVNENLKQFKISLMQWLILGVVASGPEVGISMTEVARQLGVKLPLVTTLSGKLIDEHLLRQRSQRADHRNRHLFTTAKGRVILTSAEDAVSQALDQWLDSVPGSYQMFHRRVLASMAGPKTK